jgi:hypothetical protein
MKKDFYEVTPDSGSGNATVTVRVPASSSDARSGSVTISGGGIRRTVSINQASGITSVTLSVLIYDVNHGSYWKWTDPDTHRGGQGGFDTLTPIRDIYALEIDTSGIDNAMLSMYMGESDDNDYVEGRSGDWANVDVFAGYRLSVGDTKNPTGTIFVQGRVIQFTLIRKK